MSYCADSKLKAKQAVNKRRKCEEEEKKAGVKRLKTDLTSDLSESSDSENTQKSAVHFSCSSSSSLSSSSSSSSPSSEPNSENELKSHSNNTKLSLLKKEEDEKALRVQSTNSSDSSSVIDRLSPWVDLQATEEHKKAVVKEIGKMITKEEEELVAITQITQLPQQQIPLTCDSVQSSIIGKNPLKGITRPAAVIYTLIINNSSLNFFSLNRVSCRSFSISDTIAVHHPQWQCDRDHR